MADTNEAIDQNAGIAAETGNVIDTLTGTTADDRADLLTKAQEAISGAVTSAVDAVKANPKAAAAIAVGATAAVAGAAYGANKLAKSDAKPAKRTPAKRTPAKK